MVVFEISRLDKALEEERGKEALKGLNCRKDKIQMYSAWSTL